MERTETTKQGVTLTINKPPVGEERVRRFEDEIGLRLPEDYREFLLLYNGGSPSPKEFRFVLSTGRSSNSVVDWFLSLHDGKSSNLERVVRILKDRIPPGTIPVAKDPFGNYVLLGLCDGIRNKVYFWDHEREPEAQPDWSNVDLIADSFEDFLRGLTS